MDPWVPKPWQLPLIVVALVVPAYLGFALGGAAVGSAAAALTAATLIVLAVRSTYRGPIRFAGQRGPAPVVVLALTPLDERAVGSVAALAETHASGRDSGRHEVLLLAPVRPGSLQRWLSDTDGARLAAQERLAVSLAMLAAAGVHAEGRAVDEDPVQAIEDIAAEHDACRLAVVAARGTGAGIAAELGDRVDRPLDLIEV